MWKNIQSPLNRSPGYDSRLAKRGGCYYSGGIDEDDDSKLASFKHLIMESIK